jgi:cation:H+ antiporter
MILDVLRIAAGLAVLVLAGDMLVRGAVNLALRLGIPALVVGLTIVAFGTSAPELLVSVQAVLAGAPALALGNVVGSNIANILLVMGLPALITAAVLGRDVMRDYWLMIAASVLFIALAWGGTFGRVQGLILLAALVLVMGDLYLRTRRQRTPVEDPEGADPALPGWRIAVLLVLGLIGLPLGADLLVDGSVNVATALGVSEAVIGLTLVAIGTSLPELATTLAAALRREGGVAVGNVLGSNLFNLLAIIGIASLVGPIPVPEAMMQRDLWVMLGTSLLLAVFLISGRSIGRIAGAGFLAAYAIYLVSLF